MHVARPSITYTWPLTQHTQHTMHVARPRTTYTWPLTLQAQHAQRRRGVTVVPTDPKTSPPEDRRHESSVCNVMGPQGWGALHFDRAQRWAQNGIAARRTNGGVQASGIGASDRCATRRMNGGGQDSRKRPGWLGGGGDAASGGHKHVLRDIDGHTQVTPNKVYPITLGRPCLGGSPTGYAAHGIVIVIGFRQALSGMPPGVV